MFETLCIVIYGVACVVVGFLLFGLVYMLRERKIVKEVSDLDESAFTDLINELNKKECEKNGNNRSEKV